MNAIVQRFGSHRVAVGFQIRMLMRITARGFATDAHALRGLDAAGALEAYARFTSREAERAIREGRDMDVLHKSLYSEAYSLGKILRRLLRPKGTAECLDLLSLLYRNIGITLEGKLPGELRISRCYFSDIYTLSVCRVISALDQGIFAGLCGGGTLIFTQRITEGCGLCRARFEQGGMCDEACNCCRHRRRRSNGGQGTAGELSSDGS